MQEKLEKRKQDHHIHPVKSHKGSVYNFTDKHHHPCKGDHSCWLRTISRDLEFSLFQMAEEGNFSDEGADLFNVHRDGEEYIEIGTRHEILAIFWHPNPGGEWHGHPRWPIKTKGQSNRKNQGYQPPKSALQRMINGGRISERDADRILRGEYP